MDPIRALTLNCWGVPFVSKMKKVRMAAISRQMSAEKWDIVALQEIWTVQDRELLCSAAKEQGLIHQHFFKSGVSGSGLLVLARFPIVEHVFLRFVANGKPYKVHHGDWLGGKGVGLVRLSTPWHLIDIYCTHLVAQYTSNDEYSAHRISQAVETARFIVSTQRSPVALLMGDINAHTNSLEFEILAKCANISDSFSITPALDSVSTYCNAFCQKGDSAFAQRIDYICYRALTWEGPRLCPNKAYTAMNMIEDEPSLVNIPYSDHTGVAVELTLSPTAPVSQQQSHQLFPDKHGVDVLERAKEKITTGIREASSRRRHHVRRFFEVMLLWLAGTMASILYEWRWHALSAVLAVLVVVYGILHLLVGLFFCSDEIAALTEVTEQLDTYIQNIRQKESSN